MPAGPLPAGRSLTLDFLWLELSARCNLACVHCYASSGPRTDARSLPATRWREILGEAFALGCREVQLTGGEPTLHRDAGALIEEASRLGYRTIEVFTNATNIDDAWIARLAGPGRRAAVSLYSHRAEVHDAVTRTAGSHTRTVRGIRKLVAAGVPVRVEVVALEPNAAEIDETHAFIRDELGVATAPKRDPVRPNGRGQELRAPPSSAAAFPRTGAHPSARLTCTWAAPVETPPRGPHPTCWSGKLAITPDGDALPCVFSRGLVVGNVVRASLGSVLASARVRELWSLTLGDVAECRECDHRDACFDCRSLPHSVTGDLLAKNPRCRYDPPAIHARRLAGDRDGRFVRRPSLAVRTIDGELVAVDTGQSLLHLANESATVLLAALEAPRTVCELGRALEDAFDVDAATALRDATDALALFLSRGLVDRTGT